MMKYQTLVGQYPIISDQIKQPALSTVLRELERSLERGISGEVVELGCYIGTTTLFMRRLLDLKQSDKLIYAYDSFEGLPEKVTQDASGVGEQFKAGELKVSKKQFLHEFQKANLRAPITHKGWFKDLQPEQLPDQISFGFLDGDFYESIMDSLRLVWPRLQPGGVICIDDYQRHALPGPERAVRSFFQGKSVNIHHEHNIAVITHRL
jgi:O-methyltransferase